MEGILKLVGAAVFIGLLASSASDAVPTPQTEWDDNVAKSIKDPAARSISHYNSAIRRCKDDLSGVKTSAELAGLEVNDHGNLFANELIGSIELCNSRNHLTLLVSKVHLKL